MKTTMIRLFVTLLFFTLTSCSRLVNVKVMPEYKNLNLSENISIGIYPEIPNIIIENESSLIDDLGEGDPVSIFYNFIKQNLPVETVNSTRFKDAIFLDEKARVNLEERQLEINIQDSLKISIPSEGSTIQTDTLRVDYILFLKNLKTFESTMSFGNPSSNTQSSNRLLNCSFEFLIWDNARGKIVLYGKGTSSESVTMNMNINTWRKLVSRMSVLIENDMPFDRRTRS